MAGCAATVPKAQYDKVLSNNNDLNTKVESLIQERDELSAQYDRVLDINRDLESRISGLILKTNRRSKKYLEREKKETIVFKKSVNKATQELEEQFKYNINVKVGTPIFVNGFGGAVVFTNIYFVSDGSRMDGLMVFKRTEKSWKKLIFIPESITYSDGRKIEVNL